MGKQRKTTEATLLASAAERKALGITLADIAAAAADGTGGPVPTIQHVCNVIAGRRTSKRVTRAYHALRAQRLQRAS